MRQVIDRPTEPPCVVHDLRDRLGLAVEARVEPVDLDDQHRPGLDGKTEAEGLLDGPDHQVVEHLERGRHDPGGDDSADGLGGLIDRLKNGQKRAPGLGVARQIHDHLGDDAEGAFISDDQAGQVVAGVVFGHTAGLDQEAVGHDEGRPFDVIDRHAVLERVRAARVGGDVAADRAGALARRVRRVVKAGSRERAGQPDVDHAGLDDGVAIANADLEDPLHPRQADHHAAADRERAAGQARACPSGNKRNLVPVAELDDLDDVLGRRRKDDDVRHALFHHVAVAFVDQHLVAPIQHVFSTDDRDQIPNEASGNTW